MVDRPGPSPFAGGPAEHRLDPVDVRGLAMLRHPDSGVLFLQHAHGFRAGPALRYDERGRNVSVRYSAGTWAVASIYVFPFDPPRTAAVLAAVFDESKADMLASVPAGRELRDQRTAFGHTAGGVVAGRRYEVLGPAMPGSTTPDLSLLEVFALRAWVLKIRATCRLRAVDDLETFLGAWLAASLPGAR